MKSCSNLPLGFTIMDSIFFICVCVCVLFLLSLNKCSYIYSVGLMHATTHLGLLCHKSNTRIFSFPQVCPPTASQRRINVSGVSIFMYKIESGESWRFLSFPFRRPLCLNRSPKVKMSLDWFRISRWTVFFLLDSRSQIISWRHF